MISERVNQNLTLRVGFLENAYEPDTGELIAPIAYRDEFGDPAYNVPPRPFMRGTVNDHEAEWGPQLALYLKQFDWDAEIALGAMGYVIKDQIKEAILDFSDPPNALRTIRKKGFNDPLIETGGMYDSVDWDIQ